MGPRRGSTFAPRTRRPGGSLPELIVVAWLFAFVLAALAGFAGAQGRLVALTHDRMRAEEVARTTRVVLGAELRTLHHSDITALSADSIRLRAVRGAGVICTVEPPHILVRYRGVRRPEPDKDSVLLVLEPSTEGTAHRLEAVVADARCGGGLRLALAPGPPEAVGGVALVFETGAYSLAGALRYRRGAAGRQPLTEAVLAKGDLHLRSPGVLDVSLRFRPHDLPRVDPAPLHLSIHIANGAPP